MEWALSLTVAPFLVLAVRAVLYVCVRLPLERFMPDCFLKDLLLVRIGGPGKS